MNAEKQALHDVQTRLGNRIRELREQSGQAQMGASREAGIDYRRWQLIEHGGANVTIKTLLRVAQALGVDFWDLMKPPHEAGSAEPGKRPRRVSPLPKKK